MAEGNSKQAPEARRLPCRLADAIGEDHAKRAADIAGKDINDLWMVHPSIADLQELINAGNPSAILLLRAYIRTETRQHVFTTQMIQDAAHQDLFEAYGECTLQFHKAVREWSASSTGKKMQASEKATLDAVLN